MEVIDPLMNRTKIKPNHLRGWYALAALCLLCSGGTARAALEVPTFSPAGGIFLNDLKLKITAKGSATIRYTLDGSDPTESSPVYSQPLQISNTAVVKARCFEKGQSGASAAELFAVADETMAAFSSNLPLVILHNVNGRVNARNAAPCYARVLIPGEKGRTTLTGPTDFQGFGTVKRRGRSSLEYPKNSFTFHTVDLHGDDLKVPILGMPKESAWILYAPYPDKTLMRDVLAYELSTKMGHYAPRTRFVELFVSRPGAKISRRSYAGVYVFEEKIKRDKNRVNIAKLTPDQNKEPEITGGYIFKKDHSDKGDPGFRTDRGSYFYYDTPKPEEITRQQKAYLVNYLDKLEGALYGPKFRDPVQGYAAYLDVNSMIDHHWIVEFSKNVD
ncbi:MAG: hypothetical protein JWM16_4195, partial [Verrucomicrobiales bacterium]|nr:hypothetical protein [Verrucomicrobiales bacterium]